MNTLPSQELIKGPLPALVEFLNSNLNLGLTASEAKARAEQFGFNEIAERAEHPLLKFMKKFWGPSAWMIEGIAALSLILGKSADASIAIGLLFVNAIIGLLQESRTQQVVKMLQAKLQIEARVLREGEWHNIPARDIVPGDIIKLRMGDLVPTDLKIVSGDISVDQSSLTGESREKNLSSGEQVYSGSIVRQGECEGLVTLTGAKTLYGRTVELVQKSQPKLHMEEVVSKLVKWLFAIVAVVVIVVTVTAFFRGTPMIDILPLGLVLLMGAIPIALPVMFTVSTALGAHDLSKHGVLVTRLSATEDAATMQILCVDKTGTLTLNQLFVEGVYPEDGVSPEDLLMCAALSSSVSNRDSIDSAIIAHAEKSNLQITHFEQSEFVPFTPQTRKTEASIVGPGGPFKVMKGALLTIATAANLSPKRVQSLEQTSELLAKKGFRTLGVAKSIGDQTQFLGIVALYDPPRPDSADLISRLHSLGIKVKMLTGDAAPVAQQIATDVGLGKVVALGNIDLANLEWLKTYDGIAGVFPEDKFNVIKALQNRQIIAGMTGDGVNDSPALQAAEVGIAVRGATDAARAAASVVLTQQGLTGIVDLIENGRSVYQRILTWIVNKVSRTALKTGFVGLTYISTGHLLISALGMLVLTFMTDFVKIALATDHVRTSKQPDTWNIKNFTMVGLVLGIFMIFEALGLLWWGVHFTGLTFDSMEIHTFSFLILLFMGLFSILCIRERAAFWKSRPSRALALAMLLDGAIGVLIGWKGVSELPALSSQAIAVAAVGSLILSLGVNDGVKLGLYKIVKKRE